MAWKIEDGIDYVNIHPNSGVITYSNSGMCGPVKYDDTCDGSMSATITASLVSGDTFDNFTHVRESITYSYEIDSCIKDYFVTWFNFGDKTSGHILDCNNGFCEKNVDECDIIVRGAPILAGSGTTQYFFDTGYTDSGFPRICVNPYKDDGEECRKYEPGGRYNNLHKIKYRTTNSTISSKTIHDNDELIELYFPHMYCTEEYKEGEYGVDIINIEERAFENCKNLSAVTFSAVKTIGNRAFYNCTGLTNIDWGHCNCETCNDNNNNLKQEKSIGDYAFYNCSSIPELHLDKLFALTSVGEGAFESCTSLSALTLNKKVGISNSTFRNCTSLSGVSLDGIPFIGENAFERCTSLSSVTIPDDITEISAHCFNQCSNLSSVKIPNSVSALCKNSFSNCNSLKSIGLDNNVSFNLNGVVNIGEQAFYQCNSLSSCTIGGGVTTIGQGAFSHCSGLKTVTIEDSVQVISGESFSYCNSLSSCTIGSGVTDIGNYAFYGCQNLKNVYVYATDPPDLGDPPYSDVRVFEGCHDELKIYVPSGSKDKYKNSDPNISKGWYEYVGKIDSIPNT